MIPLKNWTNELRVTPAIAARIRDGGIFALDELNVMYDEIAEKLEPADAEALRGALGLTSAAILDLLINPVLARFPELDVSDDEWEEIALKHRPQK